MPSAAPCSTIPSLLSLVALTAAFSPTNPTPEKSSGRSLGEQAYWSHVPKKFEPDSYCRACVTLAFDIHDRLWPILQATLEKRRGAEARGQRYKGQKHFGDLDELGFNHFDNGGCHELSIQNDAKMSRACEHMVDESLDALVAAISK